MKMFLLGFLACYLLSCLFIFLEEEYDILAPSWFFIKPWCVICIVVCFVPIWLYKIFRLVFCPTTQERVERLITNSNPKGYKNIHLCGNLYFFRDYEAKAFINKFFFYRVKRG